MKTRPTRHHWIAALGLALLAGPLLAHPHRHQHADGDVGKVGDAALVAAVKSALGQSLGREGADLSVTARNGQVTLRGWVQEPHQEREARLIASKVPGVNIAYSQIHTWASKDSH